MKVDSELRFSNCLDVLMAIIRNVGKLEVSSIAMPKAGNFCFNVFLAIYKQVTVPAPSTIPATCGKEAARCDEAMN